MEITFHGQSCFTIKDQKVTLALDPYEKGLTASAVTLSHADSDHKIAKLIEGEPKVFDWPGEYETLGIHFRGIHSFQDPKESKTQRENTIFHITFNGIRLCHLGNQGPKLTPQQLEQVGDVDVLFVPVGGKDVADAKKAKEIVEQIEPRLVIPMLYDTPAAFLSAMGAKATEAIDTFSFKKSELPEDTSKVVVLNVA